MDDFVRLRFGEDSYERVDGGVIPSKKQAALSNFNNQKGRFVFLLETRACLPSIKLSSVDTVIIFGSDWSPMTDLRNLQRITLDSQSEQIKIFRLYSSCTVEEKVLILARQDKTLDSNLQNISRSTSHMLLMWGASYLFNKLSEFHSGNNPASGGITFFEQSLQDVMQEFLNILSQNGKCSNISNSIILKITQNQGSYSGNFQLPGEQKIQLMDEEPPYIFWKRLLQGKQPQWKYLSGSSQRNRKRAQHFDDLQKKPEVGSDEVKKKRKKVANNNNDPPSLKPALIGKQLMSLLIHFVAFLLHPNQDRLSCCIEIRVLVGKYCCFLGFRYLTFTRHILFLQELLELQHIVCHHCSLVQLVGLTQFVQTMLQPLHIWPMIYHK